MKADMVERIQQWRCTQGLRLREVRKLVDELWEDGFDDLALQFLFDEGRTKIILDQQRRRGWLSAYKRDSLRAKHPFGVEVEVKLRRGQRALGGDQGKEWYRIQLAIRYWHCADNVELGAFGLQPRDWDGRRPFVPPKENIPAELRPILYDADGNWIDHPPQIPEGLCYHQTQFDK